MKHITEKQALAKLNANSFREVSKDKILDFMSILPNMDPELAKKALEQFPDFVTCATKVVGNFKETAEKAIDSTEAGLKEIRLSRLKTIETLSRMLENEELTFEQKMIVAETITELDGRNSEDQRQKNEFILEVMKMSAAAVVVGLSTVAAVLGGNGRIRL